ncbi:hypothetical protein ACWDBO_45240 [Streptomyces mirabilis]|jgi:hypothetical protein|uniref:hypothetical protein n=1 Tax=Streptomyces TaxID=1883 RepID=UPI0029A5100B|nr:hypothetical protein [Streptomyces sp. AK02-04a]MDX3761604.1 hypothetical protein [Streptomyces sp. AK02-04a]
MLNIGLGNYRTWPEDEYGKSSAGWRPGLSDEEVYAAANGRWKLGTRADRERYVVFSAMGIVVLAVEIDHISDPAPDGRRTIHGAILKPGNPVYDKYVGNESPVDKSQNPVQYFDSPFDRTNCACGCGEEVPSGRDFLPGHDQIAIHKRVKLVGGVLPFMDWFDATWPEAKTQA